MADLDVQFHDKQLEVFESDTRYTVVPAGRRGGKTYFAAWMLILEGLKNTASNGKDLALANVWYVAPTYGQAKDIMWDLLKSLARPVTKRAYEKDLTLQLVNGRKILLKGCDREDTLRGVGVSYLVMDEVADTKESLWDEILKPVLADYQGRALFIGTPKGKNHFYRKFQMGKSTAKKFSRWSSFQFKTEDNPYIDPEEIEEARNTLSTAIFKQEWEADFSASRGAAFQDKWLTYIDRKDADPDGLVFMTVDPNGFDPKAESKRGLDETSICVISAHKLGWDVLDIIHGRWNVRKTALQIIRTAQKYRPMVWGIEGGSLKNALGPYLHDYERQLNVFLPEVTALSHGGQKKTDRIIWALQGRFEHGRIRLVKGPWNQTFQEQLLDFPNPLVHDDLIDSLGYMDQLAVIDYQDPDTFEEEYWEVEDELTGY